MSKELYSAVTPRQWWRASRSLGALGLCLGFSLGVCFSLEGEEENYIMPEIMASYCSHMGMPLRSCARAMISGRLWVAAISLVLRDI